MQLRNGELEVMNKPYLSLIVATSFRPGHLENLLESLRRQSFTNFEVILICVKIDKCVKEIAEKHGALLLEDQGLGRCHARNLGKSEARGEIVAFLDDDVILGEDWLERVVKDFENPKIAGVGGLPVQVDRLGSPISQSKSRLCLLDLLSKIEGKYSWTNRLKYTAAVDKLSGSNMAFRSEMLSNIWFDEDFYEPTIAEDYDFCLKIRSKGLILAFDPRARAYHYSNYFERAFSKDDGFFFSRADNETYYEVKNNIYNIVFFSYQVFVAFFWSIMTNNPKVFFTYLKGVIRGAARGKSRKKYQTLANNRSTGVPGSTASKDILMAMNC
ncbi:glycosyltransferase [Candidatus Bathyarchaeota archaeon]|nr:glycosyltransferase [Candidatus Bathyarchaeota archaeon]